MTGTPFVHHTVCVIIEDLLLKGVQGLVEFEPSMTGGERCYENIGLGAFDSIVVDTSVNSFQDVVGAKAEHTEFEGSIRDEMEQISRVLDSDGGGFVDPLPEFAPEAVEHELGGSLATRVLGNTGNIQSDAFPFLIAKNVVAFLFEGLTPAGPPCRFLFQLEPCVHVIGKKTRLALLRGKMPDFMDLDQRVPLFDGFDQLGRAPGAT